MSDVVIVAIVAAVPGILLGVASLTTTIVVLVRGERTAARVDGIVTARVAGERYIGQLEGAAGMSSTPPLPPTDDLRSP